MILPAFLHRHWPQVELSLLGGVSVLGGTITLLLAPEATSPAEYGGLFIGFLLSVGTAVVGIAIWTAQYIAKAVVKAVAEMGGHQATKVFNLQTQEEFDKRFEAIQSDSLKRSNAILRSLGEVEKNLTSLSHTTALLHQEVAQQVKRGDELRSVLQEDIRQLNVAVFNKD